MTQIRLLSLCFLMCGIGSVASANPADEVFARSVLRGMGDRLGQAESFRLRAHVTVDRVRNSGQKLQFEREVEAFVRRPDRLRVNAETEVGPIRFLYDGASVILHRLRDNSFATAEAPPTIDDAVDRSFELGIDLPIGDFLFADPFEVLVENASHMEYVGLNSVRGEECHHIAIVQESIDWQIWISANGEPLPRKIVIDYKNDTSQPQYTAIFEEWEFSLFLPDQLFVFREPEGVLQVEFYTDETASEN